VLGGIMGAEHVLSKPQMREKIADQCKHALSELDLFELLALTGRPCSPSTRSDLETTLRTRGPHTNEQANAIRMARKQLGLMVADAMDYSKLEILHGGLRGTDSLVAAFGLKARESAQDSYVRFEGDAGRVLQQSEEPEPEAEAQPEPEPEEPEPEEPEPEEPQAEEPQTDLRFEHEPGAHLLPSSPRTGVSRTRRCLPRRLLNTDDLDHNQLRQLMEMERQLASKNRTPEERKKRLKELATPKVHSKSTERPSVGGNATLHSWSMWSMWEDTYDTSRPGRQLCSDRSHVKSHEETMLAAKGVYHMKRGAAPGSPGRRRRYFRQTDSTTILGFPEQPYASRAVSCSERKLPTSAVVGSWQWGRHQQSARGPTDSKVHPLAPPAFARAKHKTAEKAVSAALNTQWREDVPKLLRMSEHRGPSPASDGHPDSSVVATKESALRDTAGQLDGYRHEAVAQLIAENARLAELTPRTQRRLCRLKPLRLTD
jgi:hypothetical protein